MISLRRRLNVPSIAAERARARAQKVNSLRPGTPGTFQSSTALARIVKRVGAYIRVSTKDQALGYGLDVQIKGIQDHIDAKNVIEERNGTGIVWELAEIYEDAGESGAKQDRPAMMRLERDVHAKLIDVVAVHKFDRIGRTGRAFWHWVWALEDAGVNIISVTQEIDTTTTHGNTALQQLASFSEMEWRTILERTQNGLNMKAASGGWTGGPPPYGYYIENQGKRDSKLALDPEECRTLELAAQFIVEGGYTVDRAAHLLNLMGRLTRKGVEWTGSNLRHKFRNTALDGFVVYRNTDPVINKRRTNVTKLNPDGTPKHGPMMIIDTPMVFELDRLMSIRNALRKNGGWTLSGPYKYHPLSTRVIGQCGAHYTGVWVKAEDRRTYRCSGNKCGDSVIDAVALEEVVWDSLKNFLGDKSKLREIAADWVTTVPDHRKMYMSRIEDLEKQIEASRSLITNTLLTLAQNGVDATAINDAIGKINEDVNTKQAMLDDAREMLEEAEEAAQRAEDFQRLVEIASFNLENINDRQKAEIMDLLEIQVTLTGPVPLEGRFGPDSDIEQWFAERGVQPVEMTDELWAEVRPRINFRVTKKSHDLRALVEGLLYKARTGCPWGEMPEYFPPKEALRARWRAWKDGAWADIVEPLLVPAPARKPPLPPMKVTGNIDPRLVEFTQGQMTSQVPHSRGRAARRSPRS
ncbi:recombinase family protein [Streptomyces sp. BK022]|uniref:recombinase family protein n=1 Tax=Streptomyces sp. BK022 TaxID=2512123 RepID=UPI0010294BC4|nr:recombinase family protein [Streptomyces sp. BK022]